MAYQIDRYNRTILTIVEDGTVDQTTDIKLIGKNYAGYGEFHNENFLFLLENFASATGPQRPISGQIWFDTGNSKLKFYDGTKWRSTGGAEVASETPTGLTNGDFWWNTADEQLFVYNGNNFVLIGPQNVGDGVTRMQSITVKDTQGLNRSLIVSTINDETIFTISPYEEFTIDDNINPITGFSVIKPGVTLINSSQSTGVTTSNHRFWGTARNAELLGGSPAVDFVKKDNLSFDQGARFQTDSGIFIGEALDLKLYIENGDEGVIENQTGQNSILKIKTRNVNGDPVVSAVFDSNGIKPITNETANIGTTNLKWNNVYAKTFNGEATQASQLREGSNFRSASVSVSNNTVAVRDVNGNIFANLFQGVATTARYADLAEKYTTPGSLSTGTVVAVCDHPDHEVCAASASMIIIGVVSENPAYLMNSESEGQAIGLKGRLPVRVEGPVKKGQAVYASKDGVCTTLKNSALVGVALETNDNSNEKLVECVLKV